ncbi:hypothetical protein QTP88_019182 [Uroleucon formosanum]
MDDHKGFVNISLNHYLTMIGAIVSIPFILTPALCMKEDDPARGHIISTMIFVTAIVTFIQVTFGCRTIILLTLFSQFLTKVKIPVPTYSKTHGFSISKFNVFQLFPVLLTITIMWILCALLTMYDYFPVGHPARTDVKIRIIGDSSWFRVPYPGQWGWPTVSVAGVIGMLAGVLACTVESISYYPTTAKMCGFAVHKSLIPAIKDFRDVNPRISILTLTTQWFDISFVNLHAPTEDKRQEEKDLFYEDVMATLNAIPRKRIQIILGDMNAKIGKETTFRPVIGSHSLHNTSNDNGLRLIDLATERGLVVKSTMFPHKTIHKGSIDERWVKVRDSIKTVSESVLGKPKKIKKPWFNEICEKAIVQRKSLRTIWLGDPTNKDKEEQYKRYQKEIHNTLRREKRLEDDGTLVTEQGKLLEKWIGYFEKLLNCDDPVEEFPRLNITTNNNVYPTPSKQEIAIQIKRLKNHKSPGEDGIQAEILKRIDEEAISRIHEVIELIWENVRLPKDWNTSLICPIHKKNDPQDCKNYRGIALINVAYKILAYCILDRIKPLSEGVLGEYQGGFRPNRSTTDQIFCIRQIAQKSWEYNNELYILFIDFEKAYDSIHRPTLINILKELNFPIKLVNLIKASL